MVESRRLGDAMQLFTGPDRSSVLQIVLQTRARSVRDVSGDWQLL